MPIYEFEHKECGTVIEEITEVDTSAKVCQCPMCKRLAIFDRILSPASFKINGHSAANGYNFRKETNEQN